MENMEKRKFELLRWHDRRYQHVKYLTGTHSEARAVMKALNRGYTGPHYVVREAGHVVSHA